MNPSIFTRERRDTIALVRSERRDRAFGARANLVLVVGLVGALTHASMVAWPFPPSPARIVIMDGEEMSMDSFCDDVIASQIKSLEPITGDIADACL